jgi:hypothetical protein
MTSDFCKTYLKSQGVEILCAPRMQTLIVGKDELAPVLDPVKIQMYERGC